MVEIIIRDGLIHLRNDRVSYAIHILPGGIPMHVHFGQRLTEVDPTPVLRRCARRTVNTTA